VPDAHTFAVLDHGASRPRVLFYIHSAGGIERLIGAVDGARERRFHIGAREAPNRGDAALDRGAGGRRDGVVVSSVLH